MPITGAEARQRILGKTAGLQRLREEISALLEELPLPTPEEFEAMRTLRAPWTLEAHAAALIRNADFYVDEALVVIRDNAAETGETLQALWKKKHKPQAPLERSLRYLVERSSRTKIPPSVEEELYFDPFARVQAAIQRMLDEFIAVCRELLSRP
jgi:hypothetical protein